MKEQKIVITTDGKTTLARLYEDNKVINRAEAKCCPSDTFNFQTGAELAMSRVFEPEKEDIFPLADIKAGYLLVCECEDNGEKFNMTVNMGKVRRIFADHDTEELVCCSLSGKSPEHYWPVAEWGAGLRYAGMRTYKILAVYGYTYPALALKNSTEDRELLWERKAKPEEKPEPKKRRAFKVGDKVRVIGNTSIMHYLELGSEAEVLRVEREYKAQVRGTSRATGRKIIQIVSVEDIELI